MTYIEFPFIGSLEKMSCHKCNGTLQSDHKHCSKCGEGVVQLAAQKKVACPNTVRKEERIKEPCRKEIKKEDNFCTECGWKIDQTCFQQESKMCSGKQSNDKPCSNIIPVKEDHCSQCRRDETEYDGK